MLFPWKDEKEKEKFALRTDLSPIRTPDFTSSPCSAEAVPNENSKSWFPFLTTWRSNLLSPPCSLCDEDKTNTCTMQPALSAPTSFSLGWSLLWSSFLLWYYNRLSWSREVSQQKFNGCHRRVSLPIKPLYLLSTLQRIRHWKRSIFVMNVLEECVCLKLCTGTVHKLWANSTHTDFERLNTTVLYSLLV